MDMSDWDHITNLAEAVVQHNGEGWQEFVTVVYSALDRWLRNPGFMNWKHAVDDHCAEVCLLALEKLERDNYANLRTFFQRCQGRRDERCAYFKNWLRLMVKRLAIDYLRGHPEYMRRPANPRKSQGPRAAGNPASAQRWRVRQSYTTGKGTYCPDNIPTIRAKRCLEYLDRTIPGRYRQIVDRRASGASTGRLAREMGLTGRTATKNLLARADVRHKYRPAVEMWSTDHSDSDIARTLSLESRSQARRVIRAALRVLRDRFRADKTEVE